MRREDRGSRAWLRFAAAAAAYGLALLGLRDSAWTGLLAPLELRTAEVTAALLGWLGLEAQRDAAVLSHEAGFVYEIYYPCTGLTVAGFLVVGLFALPGRGWAKPGAAVLGTALVGVANQLRLLHLFYVGVERPRLFDFFHGAWEAAMVALVVGFWAWWLGPRRGLPRQTRHLQPAAMPAGEK